jgi:hypothetical protein
VVKAHHLATLEQLEGLPDVGFRVGVEVHSEGDHPPAQIQPLPHVLRICKKGGPLRYSVWGPTYSVSFCGRGGNTHRALANRTIPVSVAHPA